MNFLIGSHTGSVHLISRANSVPRSDAGFAAAFASSFDLKSNAAWEDWYSKPNFIVRVAGFGLEAHQRESVTIDGIPTGNNATAFGIALPYWFLGCLVALMMFREGNRLKLQRMRIRLEDGCCVGCGYDLRGSSEVCSECGLKKPLDAIDHN